MPLTIREYIKENTWFGIWKIEEADAYFERLLVLAPEEINELSRLKARRRTEWLASRWLIHVLSERPIRGALIKDEYGKPHLQGSTWHISLSHTHGYCAAILSTLSVGIDIQVPVPKITRIAHKFLSPDEARNISSQRNLEYLHVYWGIKESLYKAHGRRAIDYRTNLAVEAFNLESQRAVAVVNKDEKTAFEARFKVGSEYILTYVMAKT